jgi:hypothetical protein
VVKAAAAVKAAAVKAVAAVAAVKAVVVKAAAKGTVVVGPARPEMLPVVGVRMRNRPSRSSSQ